MVRVKRRTILSAVTLLSLAIFLRGCVIRPASSQPGSYFNKGKNAAWLGIEWVNEPHTEQEITALANDLNSHQITYAYFYVSYMRQDGSFGATYQYAADTIAAMRKTQPSINIMAWYGLPLTYVDLSYQAVRQNIATFSADLIALGFDGVQLDPEPVNNDNQHLLILLDDIRLAVGSKAILSISTRTIAPIFPDVIASAAPMMWSATYYRQIASHVDQVAVMTYDSVLPFPVLYRLWSRFQVIQISKAMKGTNAELLIGVPTSEEETFTHHPFAENMESGLQGIIDGLNDEESIPDFVTGVAIYPYWETDAAEWKTYNTQWLNRP